ncbi:5'/3'-nucleotidase SurE [Eisenibacter elegans]|jgi:5'-nucleotidase|uniref:5'/3'-nucleotidase SurE n=1 Tax=Eisenibacter elegans TaxID=997 RepID=UPI00042A41D6|nr:5'/3'-nucleotidase SurE [Eisenibacter elegans]
MAKTPLILISNDDGITSKGIRTLVEVMRELGQVIVVAPNSPQSGKGHAITIGNALRLDESDIFAEYGVIAYECSGTPADCIKLAKHHIFGDRVPDLVVSGVNHGSNSSISVLYSGTMSAAIEAAIEGLPAIGFSLCDYGHDAEFSHARPYIKQIAQQALERGIPKGIALNVNIPALSDEPIKGVKICRQTKGRWGEEFDERVDPYGRRYYWLTGRFLNEDKGSDTDEFALSQNYVSVVPCQFDMTAYHSFSILNEWNMKG